MDYGFEHDGKVFTPNGTPGVSPAENADRNTAIEAAELARWQEQPDRMLAYYDDTKGTVSTWLGTVLGQITSSRVYRHNFGGRMISLTVYGTNNARYFGRASFDNGQCITLRRITS